MTDKQNLTDQGRMLTTEQVLKMWPISRRSLWRWSNLKKESERIPSYKLGARRYYAYDELIYWRDQHRATVLRSQDAVHAE